MAPRARKMKKKDENEIEEKEKKEQELELTWSVTATLRQRRRKEDRSERVKRGNGGFRPCPVAARNTKYGFRSKIGFYTDAFVSCVTEILHTVDGERIIPFFFKKKK
jgi:hypothetical protein